MELLACADSAVLVRVPAGAAAARAAAEALRTLAPAWMIDAVPGIDTLLVEVVPGGVTPASLRGALRRALAASPGAATPAATLMLDVRFGVEAGVDLDAVALTTGRSPAEVVAALTGHELEVVLIGHLPGLPYLTGLPAWLAPPRRADPRPSVPAGSLAVAAGMACIYPVAAPGGWHLVGRTEAWLFDPTRTPPVRLRAGDRVRLRAQ